MLCPKSIETALNCGASDIHLLAGQQPLMRIDGDLIPVAADARPLDSTELQDFLRPILSDAQWQHLEAHWELDCCLTLQVEGHAQRFRANMHRALGGWGLVLRVVRSKIPSMDELSLEPAIRKLATLPHGLILVTGPTGSGKSTTLAALLQQINLTRKLHIYTIEDPIEFTYQPMRCKITQRELGSHCKSTAQALRSALRADPDVILIGEMRDLETIQLALTASETGHLVLSTLHTSDTSQTIDRIIDVFPASQQAMVRSQLANVLQAVVAQILLPRAEGAGRVAAREILLATPAVRNLVREQKTHQLYSILSAQIQAGMQPLEYSLAQLVRKGLLERQQAEYVSTRSSTIENYLANALNHA